MWQRHLGIGRARSRGGVGGGRGGRGRGGERRESRCRRRAAITIGAFFCRRAAVMVPRGLAGGTTVDLLLGEPDCVRCAEDELSPTMVRRLGGEMSNHRNQRGTIASGQRWQLISPRSPWRERQNRDRPPRRHCAPGTQGTRAGCSEARRGWRPARAETSAQRPRSFGRTILFCCWWCGSGPSAPCAWSLTECWRSCRDR